MTPVEWLFEKLWIEPKDKWSWRNLLDEAKELEKQQIEITDADIKKCLTRYNITDFGQKSAFIAGIQWTIEKINNKS
jgi:hypothetical protein